MISVVPKAGSTLELYMELREQYIDQNLQQRAHTSALCKGDSSEANLGDCFDGCPCSCTQSVVHLPAV